MSNRQIVLDTETTGLNPQEGHRIIEIAGVEIIDRRFTGKNFQYYINPERDIEQEAQAVHGITAEFLADKPLFKNIKDNLIKLLTDTELIIHNAPFDVGFLDYELKLADNSWRSITDIVTIFDTLVLARKKHPGKKNNLNALCKRYKIDNTKRKLHGALLDAHLLAEVYLAMTGGQLSLFAEEIQPQRSINNKIRKKKSVNIDAPMTIIKATTDEEQQHIELLEKIKTIAGGKCLWNDECEEI